MDGEPGRNKEGREEKGEKDQDEDELLFFADITRSLRPCELEMVPHKAVAAFNMEPWQ